MIEFLSANGANLLQKIGEHISITFSALALGCLVALPVGILISNRKGLTQAVITLTSMLQTIPSLALLALMVPLLGVGRLPAVVALFIYSLLPILRNTVLGMQSVDPTVLDAAKGMGMSFPQLLVKVQIPLAVPVIMAGIRLSVTYVFVWATLASYIGGGGLGEYIFTGLDNVNFAMILAGTIPVTVLALLSDLLLGKVEKHLTVKTKASTVEESV